MVLTRCPCCHPPANSYVHPGRNHSSHSLQRLHVVGPPLPPSQTQPVAHMFLTTPPLAIPSTPSWMQPAAHIFLSTCPHCYPPIEAIHGDPHINACSITGRMTVFAFPYNVYYQAWCLPLFAISNLLLLLAMNLTWHVFEYFNVVCTYIMNCESTIVFTRPRD
jgi:hypothetical protein